jgi:hypothetical protein
VPQLREQKDLQALRKLPFCYVCGSEFAPGEKQTRDHVPAKACFDPTDRTPPLLLPTHAGCNSENTLVDEKIGQLVGLRRGAAPEPSKGRLRIRATNSPEGGMMGGVNNLDVPSAIKRWIRGFHAALYGEPMPTETLFAMETPFPMATIEDGRIAFRPLREGQHREFVEVLRRQRVANNVDSIRCNNGKLVYECVWDFFNDGIARLCIFALDLYGWADLGDTAHFQRRACVGSYVLPGQAAPARATSAAAFRVLLPEVDPFDPFVE